MLKTFEGPGEIGSVYEAGATNPDVSLVKLSGALGEAALDKLDRVFFDMDEDEYTAPDANKVMARFREVLYNELSGLSEAERGLSEWATANIPPELTFHPRIEGTVSESEGASTPHIDNMVIKPPSGFVYAFYALSIGLAEKGTFQATRFPRRLSASEILNGDDSAVERFEANQIHEQSIVTPQAETTQNRGDIIFIPALPQPSLHGVLVESGVLERRALASSYIATLDKDVDLEQLRIDDEERIAYQRGLALAIEMLFDQED